MLVILHRNYAAEKAKRIKRLVTLNRNALHLVEAQLVAPAIVELWVRVEAWSPWRRHFERATVLQIRRDAGRPEGVIADLGFDAGAGGAPADHGVGILLG
jgi:hypothetical protein